MAKKIKLYSNKDYIIWFLVWIFLSSAYIFGTEVFGAYILGVITLLVLTLSNYKLVIGIYHKRVFAFFFFCLMSVFWALNYKLTLTRTVSILEILICMSVFYDYFLKLDNPSIPFKIYMYSGYTVLVYSYTIMGLDNMVALATEGERLVESYNNVNTICMFAASAVVLDVFYCLKNRKFSWTLVLAIPTLFLISVCQSRKALFMFFFGPLSLYFINNAKNLTKDLRPMLRILTVLIIVGFFVSLFADTNLFSSMTSRVQSLISGLTGGEEIDMSTSRRLQMIEVGLKQFKETPLLGVGIGNSIIITSREIGLNTYLHNNYVELLCCGGIVGFLLYYSIYWTVIVRLWPYRKSDPFVVLVYVMVIMILITEYGAVNYFNKITYYNFMIFFVLLEYCKRKYKRNSIYPKMSLNTKNTDEKSLTVATQQQ